MFVAGQLDGQVRYLSESGEVVGEYFLKAGTGTYRQPPLRPLGLSEVEIPLKQGKIDGIKRTWGVYPAAGGRACNISQHANGVLDGWTILLDENTRLIESAYFRNNKLNAVYRRFRKDGMPEKGYPKYFVEGSEVSEEQYRETIRFCPRR
jgi:antitoxin component YwqK of YwqJK toxin-antitoxin module